MCGTRTRLPLPLPPPCPVLALLALTADHDYNQPGARQSPAAPSLSPPPPTIDASHVRPPSGEAASIFFVGEAVVA